MVQFQTFWRCSTDHIGWGLYSPYGKTLMILPSNVTLQLPLCKGTRATPYLVPLFTLIYIVLFHLLLPSYLDVPCYLNNRQRYCSVWPERDWTHYIFLNNLFLPLGGICCLTSFYLCIGWMEALGFHLFLTVPICWAAPEQISLLWPRISLRTKLGL